MPGSAIRPIPTPLGNSNAQLIPGSSIFHTASSDYITKTPSSAGNRRTWTFSVWVKRWDFGSSTQYMFETGTSDTAADRFIIRFDSSTNRILVTRGQSADKRTTAAYRDNGWYHVCVVADTTHGTASERIILYVNGQRITDLANDSDPSRQDEMGVCKDTPHNFGRSQVDGGGNINAYMSQAYLIDGQALAPTDFGFTDPLTGEWRPRKVNSVPTQINDGTTWSSGTVTSSTGSFYAGGGADKLFDGSLSTAVDASTSSGYVEWTPSSVISFKSNLMVYHNASSVDFLITHADDSTTTYSVSSGNLQWHTLIKGSSTIKKIRCTPTNNDYVNWRAIKLDGIIMVDGSKVNATTEWYGTNGFYLPLDGTGYSAFQTGDNRDYDQSGNQNNYSSSGSLTYSLDSPSGVSNSVDTTAGITTTGFPSNYATWNPLDCGDTVTLTNGAVKQESSTWATSLAKSNFAMTSGKFYWEYNHIQKPSGGWTYMGIIDEMARTNSNADTMYSYDKAWSYSTNGTVTHDDAETAYGDSWSNGDIIGCAFDVDQGKIWFSKNGTWQNSGNPETGANPAYDDIVTSTASYYGGRGNRAYVVGTSIDTNTGSGIGELISGAEGFNYTAPKGFLPMCSNNNPIGVSDPSNYFKSLTYTGNNSTNPGSFNNISCGFQPDIVWVKTCPSTYSHVVFDSVRGKKQDNPGESFYYWKTDDSVSPYQYGTNENLHSLYGDGFTMFGASGLTNYTGHKFHTVAWKAGGGNIAGSSGDEFWKDGKQYASAALADVGSGTITPTACSVGTTPGLSILKYTGTASAGTIAHGLNKAPECIFVKCYTQDNYVYHTNLDPTTPEIWYAKLNSTAIRADSGAVWNDTAPTDTLIHIGADDATNESGQNIILYAWHSVPGLSKFNHYMGNGNADGNYVHCGFKPSFILIKKLTGTENWQMHTTALNPHNDPTNAAGNRLFANTTAVENTQANLDILSDGFKIRTTDASVNTDATTYFYCAWAETSSSGQYGGQATGR